MSENPIQDLLLICDNDPARGLHIIASTTGDAVNDPVVLFAKFIALRKLTFRDFFASGFERIGDVSHDEIAPYFNGNHLSFAIEALVTIHRIEVIDNSYLPSLTDEEGNFALRFIDDVCKILEISTPGLIQGVLGWTKLSYYGSNKIVFVPGLLDTAPKELIRFAFEIVLFSIPRFRSAIVISCDSKTMKVYLLDRDYNQTESIGDAGMLGILTINNDGSFSYERASEG